MSENAINASQILLDISRGYSILSIKDKSFYFKHPTNQNQLLSEEYYHEVYARAIKRGISTEDKLLEKCIKHKKWSIAKEEKIKSLKWTINKSNKAAQKITDQTQKDIFKKAIEGQEKELKDLEGERNQLTSQSAENWASQQRMFKMVEDHIFKDKNFKKNVKLQEDPVLVISMQQAVNKLSTKNNLLAAAYDSTFFDIYSVQYRDPLSIFKVDFFTITIFQRYLLSYASILLNKLKNCEMSDEIRQDPLRIFDFDPDAKQEKSKVTHGIDDLKESMRSKGKITAEDLVK